MATPRQLTHTVSVPQVEFVYRAQYARFLRFAVATLGDAEHGRDAVHEAFVRALKSLDEFRGDARLETWIWRILINVCSAERSGDSGKVEDAPELPESGPAEWPEVRAAVAALPERQRMVLFLRHYADLEYEEIAGVLGIARGTVAATLHQAHERLRDILSEVKR
jgi:RNA polymerase sigma-70 factor (ECF subfamily)